MPGDHQSSESTGSTHRRAPSKVKAVSCPALLEKISHCSAIYCILIAFCCTKVS